MKKICIYFKYYYAMLEIRDINSDCRLAFGAAIEREIFDNLKLVNNL
jgi:hypothetical protein